MGTGGEETGVPYIYRSSTHGRSMDSLMPVPSPAPGYTPLPACYSGLDEPPAENSSAALTLRLVECTVSGLTSYRYELGPNGGHERTMETVYPVTFWLIL